MSQNNNRKFLGQKGWSTELAVTQEQFSKEHSHHPPASDLHLFISFINSRHLRAFGVVVNSVSTKHSISNSKWKRPQSLLLSLSIHNLYSLSPIATIQIFLTLSLNFDKSVFLSGLLLGSFIFWLSYPQKVTFTAITRWENSTRHPHVFSDT